MTTKIIIQALSGKAIDITALAHLCQQAANPSYQIEMLLGIWEYPLIPKKVQKKNKVCTMFSYNPEKEPNSAIRYSEVETVTRWFRDEAHFESRSVNYTGAGNSQQSENYSFCKTFDCVNEGNVSLEWWLEQTPVQDDSEGHAH